MKTYVLFRTATLFCLTATLQADEAVPGMPAGSSRTTVLLQTSFEDGEPLPELKDHRRVTDRARTGRFALHGRVDRPKAAAFLRIPFAGMKGRRLELSFWISSPDNTRCAMWVTMDGKARRNVGSQDNLKRPWKRLVAAALPQTDQPGFFEIVAPSSHNAPPGEVWIDDLQLTAVPQPGFTLAHPESFPALATDGAGRTWLAVMARPAPRKQIRVYRLEGEQRAHAATLEPEGVTGIDAPAVTPLDQGVLLAAPLEQNDRWRIAWTRIGPDTRGALACEYLDAGGNANLAPALAGPGGKVCVVWQSNAEEARGIYVSFITSEGASRPQRLSARGVTSANPDVVALGDGRFFAAWDSARADSVDLYGAWFKDGQWGPEQRLTRAARIERHVHLAARGGEVWMAWQAQSFPQHSINLLREQRIAVARIGARELEAPLGLFEQVSPANAQLMRPQIGFDAEGRLWLTARKSIGQHEGWQPLAWCYTGREWSGPHALWPDQGRWAPVVMSFTPQGGLAAFQRDDLPRFWGVQVGKAEDWHSEVRLAWLPREVPAPALPLATTPLRQPDTEFRLRDHTEGFSLRLPRQTVEIAGRRLNLYWGDLHNHTDLSVCQRAANPPIVDLYANQRDLEQVDFTAITDHGYNLDRPQWAYTAEQVRAFRDPGRFVTLLGEEWTSDHIHYQPARGYRRYGHRNLIFGDPHYPRFFDSREGDITPRQVWDQLDGVEFIAIPHQLADTGNCPTDWTFHDEQHQPLAEIFQTRQSYEYLGAPRQAARATPFKGHFLQDAWDLGLVIGVIASPDHGGGRGKAGVWCEALTPEALFQAFHARHTFGTSGAKMSLFVHSGPHLAGDKVLRTGQEPIRFRIRAFSLRPFSRVVVLRNNQVVHEAAVDSDRLDVQWTDEQPLDADVAWYYVRLHRHDGELAWCSPLWFFKTREALEATVERARELPRLYPQGVPTAERPAAR